MRFKKPSFKINNSNEVIFSPSGRYLAQFGQRISIWDVEDCCLIAEHKIFNNNSYIGFSDDSTMMFSKNTNGEIVFFNTYSGEKISVTGEFKHYCEGSKPQFSMNSKLLLDPTWKDGLKVWEVSSCNLINDYKFNDWSLSGLVNIPNSNLYGFSLSSKNPHVGFSKLYIFMSKPGNLKFNEIRPSDERLQNNNDWFEIDTFASCVFEGKIVVVVKPPNKNQMITIVDLSSEKSSIIELDTPKESVQSLSSNGIVIAGVIHTNVYEQGMPIAEYQTLNEKTETEHLVFYDAVTFELIYKVHWPGINSVEFHPGGYGFAIASSKKSGYFNNYAHLLK